uniref:Uncharacterized protein n=1 Tax=Tetraselmis sp. GSL018 TaxID=582737 RepID=A0A061RA95_9CHLO
MVQLIMRATIDLFLYLAFIVRRDYVLVDCFSRQERIASEPVEQLRSNHSRLEGRPAPRDFLLCEQEQQKARVESQRVELQDLQTTSLTIWSSRCENWKHCHIEPDKRHGHPERRFHAAVVKQRRGLSNSSVFVAGGVSETGEPLDDVWELRLATGASACGRWRLLGRLPSPRSRSAAAVSPGPARTLYIYGGAAPPCADPKGASGCRWLGDLFVLRAAGSRETPYVEVFQGDAVEAPVASLQMRPHRPRRLERGKPRPAKHPPL